MKLVGIAGALAGYKTYTVVHKVLQAAKSFDSELQTELIDLKDYDVEFVRGTPLSYYNADTVKVVDTILAADCLVIGTPIYQASFSGALKNLLDHFPVDALHNKVTGLIATGGTDKHYLVLDYHLKPILSFLKGVVPEGNVYVLNDHFDEENEINDPSINRRIQKLGEEIIKLQRLINQK
ncbi:MAG TPA: NAD(P)H-dependent oxidoreductase [Ureibacillus sp.]|nr:NAD(P)H-dependent oxidoreductase [Ureibacillus sp.]